MKKIVVLFLSLFIVLNIGYIDVFAGESRNKNDINNSIVGSNEITSRMQIFVKVNYLGHSVIIEVEPTDRIGDVKEKIYNKINVESDRLIVMFNGKILEDSNTIQDYSIQKDSILDLYVKNYWIEYPSIKDSVYMDKLEFSAKAFYSNAYFMFSDEKDGVYTKEEPENSGIYYMKAVVGDIDGYVKLESEPIKFKIVPLNVKNSKDLFISEITEDTNVNDITIKYKNIILEKNIDYNIKKDMTNNSVDFYIDFKGNYKGLVKKSIYFKSDANDGNKELNKINDDKVQLQEHSGSIVKTSDETNMALWIVMFGVCCAFIVLAVKMLKK